jgi:hypothetical protein
MNEYEAYTKKKQDEIIEKIRLNLEKSMENGTNDSVDCAMFDELLNEITYRAYMAGIDYANENRDESRSSYKFLCRDEFRSSYRFL